MEKRTSFPGVFWVANTIEVLERFAYYGIFMIFGLYMESLGYIREELGIAQFVFILLSYMIPVISGTFADRFGFKKVLIISYIAYFPSILLLIFFKTYSGIVLTMLAIGLAAGIFKPLISGTVRAVTDKTNKTLGFGIFYAMVNVGASFGPVVAGNLRAISWDYAFYASAIAIGVMLLITIFFYKEPEREIEGITLRQKFKDIYIALSDGRFALFLLLLGVFFWVPFWAFFNIMPLYVDKNLDTVTLYLNFKSIFGTTFASFFSHADKEGVRRILGETVSHTGWVIMIFQIFVSRFFEKREAISTFLTGMLIASVGLLISGIAIFTAPSLVFLGIALFAIGEMASSPRIQEYITWIAPKEKAGLYMGANFLATAIGAFSGPVYTTLYYYYRDDIGNPEYIWYTIAAHLILGIIVIWAFTKRLGAFKELEH